MVGPASLKASGTIVSITSVSRAPAANAWVNATAVADIESYRANPIAPNTADTTTIASHQKQDGACRLARPMLRGGGREPLRQVGDRDRDQERDLERTSETERQADDERFGDPVERRARSECEPGVAALVGRTHPVDGQVADEVRHGAERQTDRERDASATLERVLGELERHRRDQRPRAEPHHETGRAGGRVARDPDPRAEEQERRRDTGPPRRGQHGRIVIGARVPLGTLAASC